MKSHRQSFLWKAFCLYSPFSSLMNQWVFRSLSPIDLQHEMCLVVFRNHQQERVSFLLLHVSASQKILSFSFCRKISLSFRPLPVNFTLIYRFQMILIVLARSVYTSTAEKPLIMRSRFRFFFPPFHFQNGGRRIKNEHVIATAPCSRVFVLGLQNYTSFGIPLSTAKFICEAKRSE